MGKRKNSTKKERTEFLKKNGYTEEDMNNFWNECIPINHKIRMLSENGLDWTDLCIWQIEELPTLKEKTLKQQEEAKAKEEAEKAEKEAKEKAFLKAQEEKYSDLDGYFLKKIDSGVELTESELEELYDNFEYCTTTGESHRWQTEKDTVIHLGDRYFMLPWMKGNTEYQESSFDEQPYEVKKHTYEKTITVTEWQKL
jgi:hypothetical protein